MNDQLKLISDSIRVIPDFPKKGIKFQDVTTLLLNPDAFQHVVDILYDRYKDSGIDAVAGENKAEKCCTIERRMGGKFGKRMVNR